jgi:hypothetical protein
VAEFNKLKSDLVSASVGPAATPAAPETSPGTPAPDATHQVTPESETEMPLDQAAKELGPLLEQMMKKGGGVI